MVKGTEYLDQHNEKILSDNILNDYKFVAIKDQEECVTLPTLQLDAQLR